MKLKYKTYIIMAFIICLTVSGLLYINKINKVEYEFTANEITDKSKEDEEVEDLELEPSPKTETIEKVAVYVCGQVRNPDVYYLYENKIIKDAINAAGGFTSQADKDAWNLAMEIQKGLQIYIPKQGEKIDKSVISYDNREEGSKALNSQSDLVNINEADMAQLTSLTGIGPVIAQNIIDYRESSGAFDKIEDITNVSRIGQGTFEKIKDCICVH